MVENTFGIGMQANRPGGSTAPPSVGPPTKPPNAPAKGKTKGGGGFNPTKAYFGGIKNIPANRCKHYNNGTCQPCKTGLICPWNARFLHTCTECGNPHPATSCTRNNGGTKRGSGHLSHKGGKDKKKKKKKKGK